jgi:uncharacterized protein RhaS with RHS repeats
MNYDHTSSLTSQNVNDFHLDFDSFNTETFLKQHNNPNEVTLAASSYFPGVVSTTSVNASSLAYMANDLLDEVNKANEFDYNPSATSSFNNHPMPNNNNEKETSGDDDDDDDDDDDNTKSYKEEEIIPEAIKTKEKNAKANANKKSKEMSSPLKRKRKNESKEKSDTKKKKTKSQYQRKNIK